MNNLDPTNGHSSHGGPPGQDLLAVSLALLASILGTPYLFNLVGPFIERLVFSAYGSRDFASFMYYGSFALSGVVIYAGCRMTFWYAIGAIVGFASLRMAGLAI